MQEKLSTEVDEIVWGPQGLPSWVEVKQERLKDLNEHYTFWHREKNNKTRMMENRCCPTGKERTRDPSFQFGRGEHCGLQRTMARVTKIKRQGDNHHHFA